MLHPHKRQPAAECRFCRSHRCRTRIVAIGFDEVACELHARDLEKFADAELPLGWRRIGGTSTEPQRRGDYDLASWRELVALTGKPVSAGRAPEVDGETPRPVLTVAERDVLRHALGIKGTGASERRTPRNRFVTSATDAVWCGLVERGLASVRPSPLLIEADRVFFATEAGRVLVGACRAELDERA